MFVSEFSVVKIVIYLELIVIHESIGIQVITFGADSRE